MLRRHRHRLLSEREHGFTLAELIVAMMILAIIIVILIGVQLSAMVTIADAAKRQQATAYANQAMETVRAMPWDTIRAGNAPGFHTAGGNVDPYFTGDTSGGIVTVDGADYTVRINGDWTSSDEPRPPLFDSVGANVMVMRDPAIPDVDFTVRAYIVDSLGGTAASVGLLVIASWTELKTGDTNEIALRSSAYSSSRGCGEVSTHPFLSACQDRFTFSSSSGFASTSITAALEGSADPAPVLPDGNLAEISTRSATVGASGASLQVSDVEGTVRRGGVQTRQLSGDVTATGFTELSTGASNNYAVSGGAPPHDAISVTAAPSSTQTVSQSGWQVRARSDDGRTGQSTSSTNQPCQVGQLGAGDPCTYSQLSGSGDFFATLDVESDSLQAMSRQGSATSTAGAGRFAFNTPGTDYGCQDLAQSGCASARATYQEQTLRIGAPGSGTWEEGAPYLVEIGSYTDSVLVQRGFLQASQPASLSRTATVRFWDGGSVQTTPVSSGASGVVAQTGEVTRQLTGDVTIVASAEVAVTPVSEQKLGEDPVVDCVEDVCALSANAGSITVSVQYEITTSEGTYRIYQSTIITGSTAGAAFERRD